MTSREVLDALTKVGAARRGQITEQWYTATGKDGQQRRQGPYFVWTWYDQGKKRTARVSAKQIEEARAQIEKGKEVEGLINELWRNLEAAALGSQKKTRATSRSKRGRRSAKPSR